MAGTFTWFNAVKFPPLEDLREPLKVLPIPSQMTFEVEGLQHSESSDPIFTEITYHPNNKVSGYDLLRVQHRQPVKITGWWHGQWVSEIVEEDQFNLFYNPKKQCVITNTKKEVGLSATRTLQKGKPDLFQFEQGTLNFKKLIKECANLKGAWFEKMQYPSIRSEAAYGDRIDKDPEFERLLQHGVLQNIVMDIEFEGRIARVNASKIGSIYFMGDYALDYCLEFWDYLSSFFQ